MNHYYLMTFLFFLSCQSNLLAQILVQNNDSTQQTKKRPPAEQTVSINMTPLLSMIVPFNKANPFVAGPYNIAFKSYRNNKGWRVGLGANIDFNDPNDDPNLNLRVGYEWQRAIAKRWYYTGGIDAMFFVGSLNLPGSNDNNGETGYGIASVWGIEYYLHDKISIATETSFFIALVNNSQLFNSGIQTGFIPPIGLFLNVKFNRKKKTLD